MSVVGDIFALLRGDPQADRVVPRTGQAARLSLASSAAMAFLAVFSIALALAAGRLADRWSDSLARSSTIRLSAPAAELDAQIWAVLGVLEQTPGVDAARALTDDQQRELLEPWFGPELPVEDLPIPRLIEVFEAAEGFDAEGLRQRLAAEAPGAVLDTHARWRRPLVESANRLRTLGWISLALILGVTGAMVTLAARSALASNAQVIRVLRLVGAQDAFIARAFVRRFTLRALSGALIGTAIGIGTVFLLRGRGETSETVIGGIGFSGTEWVWPLIVPLLAAIAAFTATRIAAFQTLRSLQ